MRHFLLIAILLSGGCTNAPLAGFLDLVHPSHFDSEGDRGRRREPADFLSRDEAIPPPGIGTQLRPVAPDAASRGGPLAPPSLPPTTPSGVSPFSLPNT